MKKEEDILENINRILLDEEVYKDKCECEKCKSVKNLTKHHKISQRYEETKFDKNNIQILCRKCHDKIHKIKKSL